MNILMNSMYYVCKQCFYLKITKNSLYPKCILSFLLNGLCVFLTSEYIHINWLSIFLQLLIPILCLNVSTKEYHILESVISNLIVVLFQTMNILLFRSLTIEYYAFSTMLTTGGCAIFYQIFKYESLEFSENMQYSISIILFIFSYLYMLLMTDLLSKTEFTYMYLYQFFNLISFLTVKENVCLTSQIKGKKVDEKELNQVLKVLGLEHKKDCFANELSGGQQQRVAIARAILAHTDIILADEPTGNLDGENAENVMDILKALNKEGKTIVLVTHDLKIANYADRIIHLEQGKIV